MFYEKAFETKSYEQMILEGSRRRVYGKDRRKYIEYMDRRAFWPRSAGAVRNWNASTGG